MELIQRSQRARSSDQSRGRPVRKDLRHKTRFELLPTGSHLNPYVLIHGFIALSEDLPSKQS